MSLLARIVRRSPANLVLAAEALVLLAFFRVCLALIPVRRIIRAITHGQTGVKPGGDAGAEDLATRRALQIARRVQWAVSAVARHSAVEFVCFPQTLAGYTMLRWRGVPSTMVYGVARSPEGELLAHTWLMVGDWIVTGGEVSGGFTAVERWT
jgi:hypothetical protein